MTDVLIRDVPDDLLSVIDARAAKLGVSRAQYLRRRLFQEAEPGAESVTADDLRAFTVRHADLADDDVMSRAWS